MTEPPRPGVPPRPIAAIGDGAGTRYEQEALEVPESADQRGLGVVGRAEPEARTGLRV